MFSCPICFQCHYMNTEYLLNKEERTTVPPNKFQYIQNNVKLFSETIPMFIFIFFGAGDNSSLEVE